MARINALIDCAIAMLAPLTKATVGAVADVVLADSKFNEVVLGGGGPINLPLIGVAYAGATKVKTLTTARDAYLADSKLAVFVLYRDLGTVQEGLRANHDLVDQVTDQLVGRWPVVVDDDGTPLKPDGSAWPVDDDGYLVDGEGAQLLIDDEPVLAFDLPEPSQTDFQLLGDVFRWIGDGPAPLPERARQNRLLCWVVQVATQGAWQAERGQRTATYEGADLTLDPQPDADPAAAGDDLLELLTQFEDEET